MSIYMYDLYFSNFGRPPVPDDLCKDSAPSRARETEESKSVQHIFAPKTEIAEPIFGNFRNGRLFPFGIIFQFQNTGC